MSSSQSYQQSTDHAEKIQDTVNPGCPYLPPSFVQHILGTYADVLRVGEITINGEKMTW